MAKRVNNPKAPGKKMVDVTALLDWIKRQE